MNPAAKYITHDISVACFLLMKGFIIVRAESVSGRYVFEFEDPKNEAQSVALQFLSSECSIYDAHMRNLRGMLRRTR